MKYFSVFFVIVCSLVSNVTLAQTKKHPATVVQAKQAIRHQFKRFANALENGDADVVANIYAADAILLIPNMKPIKGRATIRSLLAKQFELTDVEDYKYKVHQLEVTGNWAFRWGTATQTSRQKNAKTAPKVINENLKFIDVWKKGSDGKWHIYRDSSVVDWSPALRKLIKSCVHKKQSEKKSS